MFKKYKNKKKFVDRGVYCITEGNHEGCFIVNIKEYNTAPTIKKLMIMSPNAMEMEGVDQAKGINIGIEVIDLSDVEIKKMFESESLEYVDTMKKNAYREFVAICKEKS